MEGTFLLLLCINRTVNGSYIVQTSALNVLKRHISVKGALTHVTQILLIVRAVLISVRTLSALIIPNGSEPPHLAPPPHPSHLLVGPGASFKLGSGCSVLLELCCRRLGLQLSCSRVCAWLWVLLI